MDEKKMNGSGAELSDEQLNQAAGGMGVLEYDCKGGCGGHYAGVVPYRLNGQPCCVNCYVKYLQSQQGVDRERR